MSMSNKNKNNRSEIATLKYSGSLAKTVLNSLSANIAILDENGVILETNEAWTPLDALEADAVAGIQVVAHVRAVARIQIGLGLHELEEAERALREAAGFADDPGLGARLILETTEASAILLPEITMAFMEDLQLRGIARVSRIREMDQAFFLFQVRRLFGDI